MCMEGKLSIEEEKVMAVSFHDKVDGGKGVIRKYVETETSGGQEERRKVRK